MNWIILEPEEIDGHGTATLRGRRAAHVREVLDAAPGDELRIGIVNGPAGAGTVRRSTPDEVVLEVSFDDACPPPPAPWIDLAIAMPRPRALKRLLRQATTLGARRIELIGASRVEKCYFAAHWLHEESIRPLLLEGLEQAGSTAIPTVRMHPSFRRFVRSTLDRDFTPSQRILAHPEAESPAAVLPIPGAFPLLAIGPEGGWIPEEIDELVSAGFTPFSLGPRILRTETATVALMAVLGQTLDPASRRREPGP
jgi:16S rRNA (uracil1498-N3)-methyltransferase